MISDNTLRTYVDKVFAIYDRRRLNSLQTFEIANFINDVLAQKNSPKRYDPIQTFHTIKQMDQTFYGRVGKKEFFHGLKRMLRNNSGFFRNELFNFYRRNDGDENFGRNMNVQKVPLVWINDINNNIDHDRMLQRNNFDSRIISNNQQYSPMAMTANPPNLARNIASMPKSTEFYSVPPLVHHNNMIPAHELAWRSFGQILPRW